MNPNRDRYNLRRSQLLGLLPSSSAVLLTKATDIHYFFGFSEFLEPTEREAIAYVDDSHAVLCIPPLTVHPKIPGITIVGDSSESSVLAQIKQHAVGPQVSCLFVDMQSLLASEYLALTKSYDKPIESLDRNLVWKLRMLKDEQEQEALTKACDISAKSLAQLTSLFQVGMTELQVADELESLMKQNGSQKVAFPTIVAFGSHTALPHYQPGSLRLQQETPILIDFGASYAGYKADMTRTVWFGQKPDVEFIKIEKSVLEAYEQTVALLNKRPKGLTAAQMDEVARDVITKAGYGSQYIHTTGHGLGLDIHEPPSLNSRNQQLIEENMIITIEPGIYLPGKFGYRHEKVFLVSRK